MSRRRRTRAKENPGLGALLLIGAGLALAGGAVYLAVKPKAAAALPAASANQPLPAGSYQLSCSNCTFDGTTLKCQCKDFNGNLQQTQIASAGCTNGISNNNGALVCT